MIDSTMIREIKLETKRDASRGNRVKHGPKECFASGDSFVGEDPQFRTFFLQETRAVTIHTIVFLLIRFILLQLDKVNNHWVVWMLTFPVRWPLQVILGDFSSFRYPGLFLSFPFLLLLIQNKTSVIPNLAYRICEQQMGLLTLREIFIIAAVHLVVTSFVFYCVRSICTNEFYDNIVPVINYENNVPRIVQIMKEAFLTLLFVMGMRVIPVLLMINRLSVHWSSIFMYPLYCLSVDTSRITSTFSPIYLWAQTFRGENVESCHLVGQIVGAILAGHVMNRYFPEDKSGQNAATKCFI